MKKIFVYGYKKHEYSTDIFQLRIFRFFIDWFTELEDTWFVYIFFGRRWLRFSNAGFIAGTLEEKDYAEWLEKRTNLTTD